MRHRLLSYIILALLPSSMTVRAAAETFGTDRFNIEPGQTKALTLSLDNDNAYTTFQTAIILPEGLTAVADADGKPTVTLTERASDSHMAVANSGADGTLKIVCFSLQNAPFRGNGGALIAVMLQASDDFAGGVLTIGNTLFSGDRHSDVEMPDVTINVRNIEENHCYIPDAQTDTKTGHLMLHLDNETAFTAFQADIILPEEFEITDITPLDERLGGTGEGHTVTWRTSDDGRTRIVAYSPANRLIGGDSGALLDIAYAVVPSTHAGEYAVKLCNPIFTTPNARERILDDSESKISVTGSTLVESNRTHALTVSGCDGHIAIHRLGGETVSITSISGPCRSISSDSHEDMNLPVPHGIYIITIGDRRFKVAVP